MTTHYERLRERLDRQPYLVVDAVTGEARLADQPTAFRLMVEAGAFTKLAVIDGLGALEGFATKTPAGKTDRQFTMKQIAEIAGVTYHTGYAHVRKHGVLPAPIRPFVGRGGRGEVEARFDWMSAFVAGLVGTLKRQGLSLGVLARAQVEITDELLGKKRTGRKAAACKRS